jgi:hypothetical protein
MWDGRSTARIRMIKKAIITFGDETVECAALDVSKNGARVFVPNLDLSNTTEIAFADLQLPNGTRVRAQRRWQNDGEIGFEFSHVFKEVAKGISTRR